MKYTNDHPWICERETILCGWKPDYNRGFINNMNMNASVDHYTWSKRQIRDYVRMLKSFGFTGMQITDCCSNWRQIGGYESMHDRIKEFANCLHEEGMRVTLWVWASQFNGYSWYDDEVCYTPAPGLTAYEDPRVFACFDKYYDIYADLATYVDRLILHFFDPGSLGRYEDIFQYTRLIESKFKAKNPSIKMGIDTWGCPSDFPTRLVEAGFKDYMLMELPFLPTWGEQGKRERFRQGVKTLGCELGVWSWYTADSEIDQTAAMFVNARVIKDVYTKVRAQGDHVMIPTYWSEMDSYHILNLFSLYCAGQLLMNPDRDPDELLHEIAHMVYGDKWGDTVERALRMIQDARSGNDWDSYWWPYPDMNYLHSEDIYERSAKCLEEMHEVAKDKNNYSSIPLPVTPYVAANLMLPHIEQIHIYAKFCIGLHELEEDLKAGVAKEALSEKLESIFVAVPDYNAIIGVWGQRECRFEVRLVRDFCKRAGIPVPVRHLHRWLMKKRYYEYLVSSFRQNNGSNLFIHEYYEVVRPFGDEGDEILLELEKEGLIKLNEDGTVILLDSEAYKYDVCPN